MFVCECVCVCVCVFWIESVCICICVSVCKRESVCVCANLSSYRFKRTADAQWLDVGDEDEDALVGKKWCARE